MKERTSASPLPPAPPLVLAAFALLALASPVPLSSQVPAGFGIGLVTDCGGIDDGSFNEVTWRGILRFAAGRGLEVGTGARYLESSSEGDFVPNLASLASSGASLVVAPGFLFSEAVPVAAARYPRVDFLIVDSTAYDAEGSIPPNVACAVFKEEEGSFLAGVAAGLAAKEAGRDAVGFLGGMRFKLIEKYQAGFEQGVRAVFPEARILVEYADGFADPAKGREIAEAMFEEGAAVIYHAAGLTGRGAMLAARESALAGDSRWIIGVDVDQYGDGAYGPGRSVVLTSIMKRVDVAACAVGDLAAAGAFPGGELLVFGLREGGMSLPERNPNLAAGQLAAIEEYRARIASGEIPVSAVPENGSGSPW